MHFLFQHWGQGLKGLTIGLLLFRVGGILSGFISSWVGGGPGQPSWGRPLFILERNALSCSRGHWKRVWVGTGVWGHSPLCSNGPLAGFLKFYLATCSVAEGGLSCVLKEVWGEDSTRTLCNTLWRVLSSKGQHNSCFVLQPLPLAGLQMGVSDCLLCFYKPTFPLSLLVWPSYLDSGVIWGKLKSLYDNLMQRKMMALRLQDLTVGWSF